MKRLQQTGMTLIEIMVTLGVVAILATVAAPSLQSMIERNQLQTLTNNMVSNLYFARSEAAKRGFNVALCASDSSQNYCDTAATSFANGWIIFTDYDSNLALTNSSTLFDTDGDGTPNYVDLDDEGHGTMNRYRKKSFYWYKKVIETNGEDLD